MLFFSALCAMCNSQVYIFAIAKAFMFSAQFVVSAAPDEEP